MNTKYILFFLIFNFSQIYGQNISAIEEQTNELQNKIENRCFENLNPKEVFQKYPSFQKHNFCTVIDCIFLLAHKEEEEDVHLAAVERLKEIATILYNEKTPVILTTGMDSFLNATEKNKNLNDDDKIIYVSIGDCINPAFINEGKDIFNTETYKLIHKK